MRELPSWFRWAALALLITSILFSVTRGALMVMVAEFGLLVLLLRRVRTVLTGAIVTVAVVFILVEYANIGPLVTVTLEEVRPPAGQALVRQIGNLFPSLSPVPPVTASPTQQATQANDPGKQGGSGQLVTRMFSNEDPSTRGHLEALRAGALYVARYPLGTGLGSSVPRFGDAEGPGESALLAVFGEMGLVGGLLYLVMYGASLAYSFVAYRRVRGDPLSAGLALVPLVGGLALIPIMITSAIWGNFSVTFLFWWTSGLCLSLIRERDASIPPAATEERPRYTAKESESDESRLALPHTV
jgi:hypothetical protein